MKIPMNLLVFVAVAGVFYLVILPKKTSLIASLMESAGAGGVSREDSAKTLVEARIRVDICPQADLSEYRPGSWKDYYAPDPISAEITHQFDCDGQARKFLFRLRYGSITEIIAF